MALTGPNDGWATGLNVLLRLSGGVWTSVPPPQSSQYFSLALNGGQGWAVGGPSIMHLAGGVWTHQYAPGNAVPQLRGAEWPKRWLGSRRQQDAAPERRHWERGRQPHHHPAVGFGAERAGRRVGRHRELQLQHGVQPGLAAVERRDLDRVARGQRQGHLLNRTELRQRGLGRRRGRRDPAADGRRVAGCRQPYRQHADLRGAQRAGRRLGGGPLGRHPAAAGRQVARGGPRRRVLQPPGDHAQRTG